MLARDRRLGIVQRQIERGDLVERLARQCWQDGESPEGVGVARLRRVEQRLGLLLQLVEIRTGRELAGRHKTSMLQPCGSQTGSTAVLCRWWSSVTVGLALRANPLAPFTRARPR